MQTKHLCVLIHIWTKGEVGGPLNRFKPSSKIFLLTVPRRCFFCGSFMLFLSCYAFKHICLLMPSGRLLGKGWPLDSRLWCLIVTLSLSHWYPGSGVVLDCIDSWSLPSFFLCVFFLTQLCLFFPGTVFWGKKNSYSVTVRVYCCHIPRHYVLQVILTCQKEEFPTKKS